LRGKIGMVAEGGGEGGERKDAHTGSGAGLATMLCGGGKRAEVVRSNEDDGVGEGRSEAEQAVWQGQGLQAGDVERLNNPETGLSRGAGAAAAASCGWCWVHPPA